MRIGLILGLVVATALALSACGSSGKSDKAHRQAVLAADAVLTREGAQFSDPALVACTKRRAAGLSTARLEQVGVQPVASQKQFAAGLLTACIRANAGASSLRAQLSASIDKAADGSNSPLPAGYLTCVKQKAANATPDQIADIVGAYPQGQTAVEAKANGLGKQLGLTCLGDPTVGAAMRADYLKAIRQGFVSEPLPTAVERCILKKAEALPTSTIIAVAKGSVTGQASEQTQLETLQRQWAKQCAASAAS